MAVDQNHVERFKKALSTLALDEIQRRLDGSQIVRPWKRRLAETEGARRDGIARAAIEQARRNAADARRRRADVKLRVWNLVAIAIAGTIWRQSGRHYRDRYGRMKYLPDGTYAPK